MHARLPSPRSCYRLSLAVFLGANVILITRPLFAQTQAPPPAVGAANPQLGPPPAPPTAPNINILILALDDLTVTTDDLLPLPAAPTEDDNTTELEGDDKTPPGAITPGAPADDTPDAVPGVVPGGAPAGPLAPITPAGITPAGVTPALFPGAPRVEWRAFAAKKDNKDDELFKLEPDGNGLPPVKPAAPNEIPRAVVQAGESQLAAFPLRRALLAMGYTDVLATGTDGNAIVRALGDGRLTPRVLNALKSGLNALQNAGTDQGAIQAATAKTTNAASAIGQILGYRAVIVLHTGAFQAGKSTPFSVVLADASRETAEPILWDEQGNDANGVRENGGTTGAALLDKSLKAWPAADPANKTTLVNRHMANARAALAAQQVAVVQDELNQAIALNPKRSDIYVLLGDALLKTDPLGAANVYRRATDLNLKDGETWAKMAASYVNAPKPDWPRALEAGRKALDNNYDTADLRISMATAQFGRASLFRRADRRSLADSAEAEARKHLDRALELAPDDPNAVRLLASSLIDQNRMSEAASTLDRVAPRYLKDIVIQTQYAKVLSSQVGREEDAFVAYSRVWQLSGQRVVDVEPALYRSLAEGFDERLYNIGRSSKLLADGVSSGTLARESALLQLAKLKEDADAAETGITTLRTPSSVGTTIGAARVFAASLMSQSLEAFQTYLETGQENYRQRGSDLYKQAVAQLNAARAA